MIIETITEAEETRTLRTEQEMTGPHTPPRGEYNHRVAPVLFLESLTKRPKEILATKTQLHLPAPHPMLNPLRSRNTDRYYDYHQEKGHYTNDCIQLRKQLEMALEWGKLNYLVKDVRQRERGSHGREAPQPAKNKGQIEGNSNGFRKVSRRNIETTRKDRTGGRPRLKTLRAIPSTIHSMMKFQTSKGVATLVTRTIIIAECRRLEKKQMIEESFEGEGEVAATEEVLVNPSFPDQRVTIGGGLSETCREQLKCLLKDNMWVFAWEPSDMMGVPRRIIEHTLNVNPSMDPVCQKRRTFSMEKSRW
ncbi:hypothetical protein Tco_0495998 [Tanacetum coccineum]